MSVFKQLNRQQTEMNNIIESIKKLQNDISSIKLRLNRSEDRALQYLENNKGNDEVIEKCYTKFKNIKNVYIYIIIIIQAFREFLDNAYENEQIINDTKGYEKKLERLLRTIDSNRIETVNRDLKEIKKENSMIQNQLRELKTKDKDVEI